MLRLKEWHFVWFLSLLIIFQSLWISSRLDIAFKNSPEVLQAETQRKKAKELAKVPEAKIEEKLAKGGRLWFEPKEGEFDQTFEIEVWALADEPISKADLRIFYSPTELQFINSNEAEVDESIGLISLSQEFEEAKEDQFKLAILQFGPKTDGETELKFDFSKESLTDCNLINEKGEDVLEEVAEGKYRIRN